MKLGLVALFLAGITQGSSSRVSYEYHTLEEDAGPSITNRNIVFSWEFNGFSHCSVSCGTGIMASHAHCTDSEFPEVSLPDNICSGQSKPLPIVRKCKRGACPGRWVEGDWSQCSSTCGGGNQSRQVQCKRVLENNIDSTDKNKSSCNKTNKPATVRACNGNPCDARWRVGEWNKCSMDCGRGERTRSVECVNSHNVTLNRSSCDVTKEPVSTQPCNMGPCYYSWHPLKWKSCSTSCGTGNRTRTLQCRTHTRRVVDPMHCPHQSRLDIDEPCTRYFGCTAFNWTVTDWSACKGDCCGATYQNRAVRCTALVAGNRLSVPDMHCMNISKPNTRRPCNRNDCPQWKYGNWSSCLCEIGQRHRPEHCLLNGKKANTPCCPNKRQPKVEDCTCPTPPCRDQHPSCSTAATALQCRISTYVQRACCATCQKYTQ